MNYLSVHKQNDKLPYKSNSSELIVRTVKKQIPISTLD